MFPFNKQFLLIVTSLFSSLKILCCKSFMWAPTFSKSKITLPLSFVLSFELKKRQRDKILQVIILTANSVAVREDKAGRLACLLLSCFQELLFDSVLFYSKDTFVCHTQKVSGGVKRERERGSAKGRSLSFSSIVSFSQHEGDRAAAHHLLVFFFFLSFCLEKD